MSKSREFLLVDCQDYLLKFKTKERLQSWADEMDALCETKHKTFHVIDYSAYEAERAARQKLEEALELQKIQWRSAHLGLEVHGQNIDVPFWLELCEQNMKRINAAIEKAEAILKGGGEG